MKDIKDKMQDLINRQKQRLTKEILECERKLNDTLSYYGVGGPYHRQEDALDRRKKQLDELEDFENQLKMAKKTPDRYNVHLLLPKLWRGDNDESTAI